MEFLKMNLAALKETRATKVDALKAIIAKAEAEKRDLSDGEQHAFDAGKVEIEKLERQIRDAEFLADAERRMDGAPVANADKKFESECREYSLIRAIASQVPGLNIDSGREKEISRELEHRSGRTAQGMLAPTNVFEQRVVTTTLPGGGPGSNIISTDLRGDLYVDRLRAMMAVRRLGARVLTDLRGNVDIPRLKASTTAAWVAENAAISATDPQFEKVSLTPKHVGVITEYSRNMLQQSSPDIEQILRDDFAGQLAEALDSVAILGGGTNQPTGILATAGVTDVPGGTNGLAPTYANVVLTIAAVAGANALAGSLGFLTNSKVVAKAAVTLKSGADTASSFIIPNPGANELAGYPMAVSNLVPSNIVKGTSGATLSALIFGNWADLLIGYWSAFDLLVNPYESTAYSKGNVQVRGMLTADIKLRHPESFAKLPDIITV
jgi:HK97 family phage major capsid protein